MGSIPPKFRLLIPFLLVIGVFYAFWVTPFFKENILLPWTIFNATVAAKIMAVLGLHTTALGDGINSPYFSLSVKRGCDALEPAALFLAGVVAATASLKHKLIGAFSGISALLLLNFVRIISLFLIGRFWNSAFEFFHVQFWQVLFIMLALLFLWIWLKWSAKKSALK